MHSNKYVLGFICFLMIGMVGCKGAPSQRPDDFSLYSYWNTGALPPEYYYEIEIEINSDRSGNLTFQRGYEIEPGSRISYEFSVNEQEWNDFYDWMKENDLFKNSWEDGSEISEGGSGTLMKFQTEGVKYEIPSISMLAKNDRAIIAELQTRVNALVSEDVWNAVEVLKP